ncbi:MAG: SAM-dependent methyltransferase [Pseudonocardiales bacterium]|nr:MAG: SAM-dependent methyltransferase [Pseudonocardiales bacterium]
MYGAGLRAASAGRAGQWTLRYPDGTTAPLALGRWCGSLVDGDHGLLRSCSGATLDVGCGPGRLAAAAAWQGLPALGIDVSATAVRLARERGVAALLRSVFERLPAEGRWRTALLADGNIGIGGDPLALLARVRSLLGVGGRVICELDPPSVPTRAVQVSIEDPRGLRSPEFGWAHVSVTDIGRVATAAGLVPVESWEEAGRWFSILLR